MPHRRENLGLLLGFVGIVMFGGTLPAARLAVMSLDPFFLTAARAAIAGLAALIVLLVLRRRLPPRADWTALAIGGAGVIIGFPLFSTLAMAVVPAAHGGVILGLLPLATVMAAALFAGERPSLGFWLASLAGTALVVAFAFKRSGAGALALGDLLLIGSVIAAAVGYVYSGRLAIGMPGWEVISWEVVLCLPLALVGVLATWPTDVAAVPAPAWVALAYVGLFSQFIGFFLWNAGLAIGGIARVSQIQLLQPFVIAALAVPVNGEPLELETVFFLIAVSAMVMVAQRMRVAR
jgi:drug/metabolite transporter (DMT)-like permease